MRRYAPALRFIHWLTALLVFVQVTLAVLNIVFYEPRPVLAERLVQAHLSLGAVIFMVTVVRLGVRLGGRRPTPLFGQGTGMAARTVHGLLYVCLMVLPVSGYIKLAALGFEITLFGVVALPALPVQLRFAAAADTVHDTAALALGTLLVLHIAAAFAHKTGVWARRGARRLTART
ncbi:MAG: cytochrome b/b6 domain-containing protein [Pseudomonadota bacterium]